MCVNETSFSNQTHAFNETYWSLESYLFTVHTCMNTFINTLPQNWFTLQYTSQAAASFTSGWMVGSCCFVHKIKSCGLATIHITKVSSGLGGKLLDWCYSTISSIQSLGNSYNSVPAWNFIHALSTALCPAQQSWFIAKAPCHHHVMVPSLSE